MSLFDLLFGRPVGRPPLGGKLLASILLGQVDPHEPALAERTAVALHAASSEAAFMGRKAAAAAAAALRRHPGELAEALFGVMPWEVEPLAQALAARRDLSRPGLAAAARSLADSAGSLELLAASLSLLGFGDALEDIDLLVKAGRSVALARPCADALARRGAEDALVALARGTSGVGRSLVVERLGLCLAARATLSPADEARADEAMEILGGVGDPVARAYGAVLMLEVGRPAPRIASMDFGRLSGVAECLQAVARGGWNGGPGPGLGRMPHSLEAAEAVLARKDADPSVLRITALAVMTASPMPAGPVRQLAERTLREVTGG